MKQKFKVTEEDHLKRVDVFISKKSKISRSKVQRLIKNGAILVGGKIVNPNYRVKKGDIISLNLIEEEKKEVLIPEPIPINILYKDDHIIVVDKPSNTVVYPAPGHNRGTLMNAIAYYSKKLASIGAPLRPGVVHRLDKDTSGVMVIALDDMAYYSLTEQFKNRTINRKYIVLVYGDIKEDTGEISVQIGRSISDRKKMSIRTKRGKEAITKWRVLKRYGVATLIEARLGTGRTHQIRVHFSAMGHPVMGDRVYGRKTFLEIKRDSKKEKILFLRQMLHAESLGFVHPVTNQYMEFSSPMPEDMADYIRKLQSI